MKRQNSYCILVLAVLLNLLTFLHAEAAVQNKVEGTLTFDKVTIQLKNIYVSQQEDEVAVFMTDKSVPPDKIPYDIVDVAGEGKVAGFSVGISKSEKKISEYSYFNVVYHKAVNGWGQMQLNDFGKLEIKTYNDNTLEAKLSLDKPGKVFGSDSSEEHTYSYNVTFSVNLGADKEEPMKSTMKPDNIVISGDDTPPGKAYASYYRAKLTGDIDEIKKWVVQKHVKDFDGKMGKMMITVSMKTDPKEIKIVATDISGGSAKLSVKGKNNDQSIATGSVVMAFENGQWKVETDKWKMTE